MVNTVVPPDLLEAGFSSYIEAMIAVRAFRREIQSIAREVVERRMPELTNSIGFERDKVSIGRYANPDGLDKEWDGSYAWVTILLRHPSFDGHFGWLWRDDGEQLRAGVVATFAPNNKTAPLHTQLLQAVRTNGIQNVYETYRAEISLWEPLAAEDIKSFGSRLDKLIDDWILVWTSAGGLKGLTGAGSSGSEKAV